MASTEKQVQFKVESLRRIPDPVTPDARARYSGVVNVENLPADLPMDTNPRDQKTTTNVARAIKSGLRGETAGQLFHLLNRGLLISADRVDFNNKTNVLTVYLPDGERHGLVDGGHTYKIIQDNIGVAVLLEIDNNSHAFSVGFVPDVRNIIDLTIPYAVGNLGNNVRLDDHVRYFCDNNAFPAAFVGFDV